MVDSLAQFIDATLLKSTATFSEIQSLCEEALTHQVKTVCIPSSFLSFARDILKNSRVSLCTVVGFPLGNCLTSAKVDESIQAIEHGATEIDMVMHQGAFHSGEHSLVESDIKAVAHAVREGSAILKVIIETSNLVDDTAKILAAKIAADAGAHFVKTSTGFAGGGATIEDIRLLRASLPASILIKASGGIKTRQFAQALIDAGATRLGTSNAAAILSVTGEGKSEY